jgi:hypothetical protein
MFYTDAFGELASRKKADTQQHGLVASSVEKGWYHAHSE